MKITIGKGLIGDKWSSTLPLEAKLSDDMCDMTMQMIGDQLAKQFGIEDGVIEMSDICFSIKRVRK